MNKILKVLVVITAVIPVILVMTGCFARPVEMPRPLPPPTPEQLVKIAQTFGQSLENSNNFTIDITIRPFSGFTYLGTDNLTIRRDGNITFESEIFNSSHTQWGSESYEQTALNIVTRYMRYISHYTPQFGTIWSPWFVDEFQQSASQTFPEYLVQSLITALTNNEQSILFDGQTPSIPTELSIAFDSSNAFLSMESRLDLAQPTGGTTHAFITFTATMGTTRVTIPQHIIDNAIPWD